MARSDALTRGPPSCGRIVIGLRVVVASELPCGDEGGLSASACVEDGWGCWTARGRLDSLQSDGDAGASLSVGPIRRGEELGVDATELSGELW